MTFSITTYENNDTQYYMLSIMRLSITALSTMTIIIATLSITIISIIKTKMLSIM